MTALDLWMMGGGALVCACVSLGSYAMGHARGRAEALEEVISTVARVAVLEAGIDKVIAEAKS